MTDVRVSGRGPPMRCAVCHGDDVVAGTVCRCGSFVHAGCGTCPTPGCRGMAAVAPGTDPGRWWCRACSQWHPGTTQRAEGRADACGPATVAEGGLGCLGLCFMAWVVWKWVIS